MRYTLVRNDERDLQFDGVVLAEVEQYILTSLARVAVYRTQASMTSA